MGKHFSDNLYSVWQVMRSDEDQPIVMVIHAGFTVRDELAVSVDLYDYEEPWYNCSTAAIVNIDDARRMARRHRVPYDRLPMFIVSCMEDWREIVNASFRQVVACFKEITECLLDEGCRFRIERTCGSNDRICC